jgi:hypothetical protein
MRRWKNGVKESVDGMAYEGVDSINLPRDAVQWGRLWTRETWAPPGFFARGCGDPETYVHGAYLRPYSI